MTGQQEIRNPFFDLVLVPTASTNQLPFANVGLKEQGVQVAQHAMLVFVLEDRGLGFLGWDGSETELLRNLEKREI